MLSAPGPASALVPVERLQRDPLALDRAARQELGLVATEDVVLVLPEAPAGAEEPA